MTCGQNCPILQWDCDIVDPVDKIEYPYKLLTIDVSPSGKYMALGSETAEVLLFEVKSNKFIGRYSSHSDSIIKLKWSPDEKQIVSVSCDSSMCIWNFFG